MNNLQSFFLFIVAIIIIVSLAESERDTKKYRALSCYEQGVRIGKLYCQMDCTFRRIDSLHRIVNDYDNK